MLKNVVVAGRTLTQSNPLPGNTVVFTLVETDLPAQRITASGSPVLLQEIRLACTCSGSIDVAGNITYTGAGNASITASTPRVSGEGQQVLLEGDNVTLQCDGTSTNTQTSVTTPGVKASVTVTVTNAGQNKVLANDT